jgi:integrase
MQSFLDHLRRTSGKTGTIRQYKSNYNTWIPETIGARANPTLERAHWSGIFDPLAAAASPATIKNVNRTLNAMIGFADDREFFGTRLPFNTTPERRASIVREARELARKRLGLAAQATSGIALDMCPDVASVDELAEAVEAHYPDYGRRMVLLAFGTGLRICEILALRADHIDVAQGLVHVDQQLNRYAQWPAVVPPKGDKDRKALIWTAMLPVAESLMIDATRLADVIPVGSSRGTSRRRAGQTRRASW